MCRPSPKSHNVQHVARAVYTGLAEATTKRGGRLFAANASMGTVDVFNAKFKKVASFRDPSLPKSVTPYNVALLRGKLYVTFAPPPGPTTGLQGAIDVFSLSGHKIRRLVTGGQLFAPWGMVIAPRHWGRFGGDLLVGNVDNGRINAFNPSTGKFRGTLRNKNGKAIANSGLWGLAFGNGVIGTPRTLLFSAGIDNYSHGLVGLIRPPPARLRRLASSTGMSSGRGFGAVHSSSGVKPRAAMGRSVRPTAMQCALGRLHRKRAGLQGAATDVVPARTGAEQLRAALSKPLWRLQGWLGMYGRIHAHRPPATQGRSRQSRRGDMTRIATRCPASRRIFGPAASPFR